MNNNRRYFFISITMLLLAAVFVAYALNHPEASTPFSLSLTATRMLYIAYAIVMVGCLILSARKR